VQETACD